MKIKKNNFILILFISIIFFNNQTNIVYSQNKFNNLYELSKKSGVVIIPLTDILQNLEDGSYVIKQSFIDSLSSLKKLYKEKKYTYYINFELLIIDSSIVNSRMLNAIENAYDIISNLNFKNVRFTTSRESTLTSIQLVEAYKNHNVALVNGIIFEPTKYSRQ